MPARFRIQQKPLRVARGQIWIPSSVMFPVRRLRVGCVRIRMRTVSRCRQIRPAGSYLRISFSFHRSSNKRTQASSHDSLSEFECPYACLSHGADDNAPEASLSWYSLKDRSRSRSRVSVRFGTQCAPRCPGWLSGVGVGFHIANTQIARSTLERSRRRYLLALGIGSLSNERHWGLCTWDIEATVCT